jgi:glycosyltransferase involved in cell wall biosynthesis
VIERPLVVFFPARNEAATIADVVRRTPAQVDAHPVVALVVDDGSTDETAAIARAAGAHVVSLAPGRGLGAAVRTGLREALAFEPAAIAFCDADGEYAPEELERLVGPVLAGDADYVVGSRFAGGPRRMRLHRNGGNRLLTSLLRMLSGIDLTDGQSGYRALSAPAARAAEIAHDYNYAQVLTLDVVGRGFRYAEVPISYTYRQHGRSFVRLLPYLAHVVPAVWRVHRQTNARRELVLDDVVAEPVARV